MTTLGKLTDSHFFRRLALKNPLIITQTYSINSFLTGNVFHRHMQRYIQDKADYSRIATIDDASVLPYSAYKDRKKCKDLTFFLVEPWLEFSAIETISSFCKHLYVASSLESHYEAMKKRYGRTENLTMYYCPADKDMPVVCHESLSHEQADDKFLKRLARLEHRSELVSIERAHLLSQTSDHFRFDQLHQDYSEFFKVSDGFYSGRKHHEMQLLYNDISKEAFIDEQKGKRILYIQSKIEDPKHYDRFLLEMKQKSDNHFVDLDAVVLFSYRQDYIHYYVVRLNLNINVLELFKKHKPEGHQTQAVIRKHPGYFKKSVILKL